MSDAETSSELVTTSAGGPLTHELARAASYAARSRADNTRRAYASDLRTFAAWCKERGVSALPAGPNVVAAFLASLADAGRCVATIERALTAISKAHSLAGLDSPRPHGDVRETMAGIRRTLGTAQHPKEPLLVEKLRTAVETLPLTLAGVRDRAVLLLGWAGAFRRSSLVRLHVEDFSAAPEGLVVLLRRSKTDQEGKGRQVPIPFGENVSTCPVRAVNAWLEASGLKAGPLFRPINRHGKMGRKALCDRSVALIVKAAAERSGLDPANFAGHSLRSGLATQAALAGKEERDIMRQTGHTSIAQVRKYIRAAELFRSNAASGIGL